MGIRLYCPNGHKVHVKSFLAGKRGICPQCGAKFDIPTDHNPSSDDDGGDEISIVGASPAVASQTAGPGSGSAASSPPDPIVPRSPRQPASDPADPAGLDFDALAAAGDTGLLGGHTFGPAGQRLAARRKSAQTRRTLTLVLTVTVTLLACVLLYIVFRSR